MKYPILSKKNIEKFIRDVQSYNDVNISHFETNDDSFALHLLLSHKEDLGYSLDDSLSQVGFRFKPCNILDEKYGIGSKYYTFKHKGSLWTATGDNCYGDTRTRVLIEWEEKLDPKTKEEVLYEINN